MELRLLPQHGESSVHSTQLVNVVVVEVNGGYQYKFVDTEWYFGPVHEDELVARVWLIQTINKSSSPSSIILNPQSTKFYAKEATEELQCVMEEIKERYPAAAEYILECTGQVPLHTFYSKKERMYAQLKGIDLHGWEEVDTLLIDRKTVVAIKTLRAQTGLGLKESKELVDKRREYLIKNGRISAVYQ